VTTWAKDACRDSWYVVAYPYPCLAKPTPSHHFSRQSASSKPHAIHTPPTPHIITSSNVTATSCEAYIMAQIQSAGNVDQETSSDGDDLEIVGLRKKSITDADRYIESMNCPELLSQTTSPNPCLAEDYLFRCWQTLSY
jgi:hypothetical protein